jgi:hypothetical protein
MAEYSELAERKELSRSLDSKAKRSSINAIFAQLDARIIKPCFIF